MSDLYSSLKLSSAERTFYENVYSKLRDHGQALDEHTCKKLVERGVDDPDVCDTIWEIASGGSTKTSFEKKELFTLLKLVAAYQNGHKIDNIALESLSEMPIPKLPKMSAMKESSKVSSKSSTTKVATSASQVSVGSLASQVLKSNNDGLKNSGTSEKDNVASNNNGQMSTANMLESKLISTVLPEKVNKYNFPEEIKTEDKKEEPKEEEIKVKEMDTSNKRSPMQEMDADLIDPGKIENVEVPDYSDSVRVSNPNVLVNPYKLDSLSENSSDVIIKGSTKTEPEAYEEITKPKLDSSFERMIKGYHRPVDGENVHANIRKYNNYLEEKQKIKIEITDNTVHNGGIFGYGTYVTYMIKSEFSDSEKFITEKRFSDFDWLNSYLRSQSQYKGLVFPRLPEKKSIGATDPNFVHQRKVDLEKYLKEIAIHNILSKDPVLRVFLGDEKTESFQSIKDKKPFTVISLNELDWHKMKEAYEYKMASIKIKLRKEESSFDWKDTNEKINEFLQLDVAVAQLLHSLERKDAIYKKMQGLSSDINIFHTKLVNKIDQQEYYALGALSSVFMAEDKDVTNASIVTEGLLNDVKVLKNKMEGFKESYAVLLDTLQDILTNKELLRNKHSKSYEYQADSNSSNLAMANKDINEIEKKVQSLLKEAETIRDNLSIEIDNLFEQFEVFLPDILNEYYKKQQDRLEKAVESWKSLADGS